MLRANREKKRGVVICFSLFMALVLFQTSFLRLGTIAAFATLLLTFAAFFFAKGLFHTPLRLDARMVLLLAFLVYTVLVTLFGNHLPGYFLRYIAQILLCCSLFSINLTKRENVYLKNVFLCACVVYAVLTAVSCIENMTSKHYHSSILLFNAELDPNFVGLPLVAASALALDNILRGANRWLSVLAYGALTVSIVLTASRGNFVGLIVSNILVLLLFLLDKNIKPAKKVIYLLLPVVVVLLLTFIFKEQFPQQWERMSNISAENDNGRFELWETAWAAWLQSPVFGNGLGYAYTVNGAATHNTYLQVLSETGVFGLGMFIVFLFAMLRKAYRSQKVFFAMLAGMAAQLFFLDALDNRALWVLLCWIAMV